MIKYEYHHKYHLKFIEFNLNLNVFFFGIVHLKLLKHYSTAFEYLRLYLPLYIYIYIHKKCYFGILLVLYK